MKSHQMSVGKIFLYSLFVVFFTRCAAPSGSYKSKKSSEKDLASSEVSLAKDQQSLEELRKNIPQDVKARNDSLKIILNMMGELKEHPQKVRDKFNRFQRQRRTKFQKEQRK
ncbi:MAG: hypothetical protein KDD40_13230, partial [Bdellovibrionales bacterium]|nr:hypothetical protein [Bdellovibrionales bacterium]